MRILHLSDTHNHHHLLHNLPAADIIVHSGDLSMAGTGGEVDDFVKWFAQLDYPHKIFIAGNHDDCLCGKNREIIQRFLPSNCHYLCYSGVEINGIKFWGVPFFMLDDVEGRFPQIMAQIPPDTDVLISHRPPYGILDAIGNIYGCPDLLLAVQRTSPRYHLFGHIHAAYGIKEKGETTFVNAALANDHYELVREPVCFNF